MKSNPLIGDVAARAAAAAAAKKTHGRNEDEMWLAKAELDAIERQIRGAETNGAGAPRIPRTIQRQRERAGERFAAAKWAFDQSAEVLRVANGELMHAQKAAQTWDEQQAHIARQVAAEAEANRALTPKQRAIRDARRLLDAEGVR